jgi:meiotically up-regulated gene 157 (Mug157) protein
MDLYVRDLLRLAALLLLFLPVCCTSNSSGRPAVKNRTFVSSALEEQITEISADIIDPKLKLMFEKCYPNTLDTTVSIEKENGKTFTHIITGDIPAMWLRDSSAQVKPYMNLMDRDPALKEMIHGLVNSHIRCTLKDPYANAFLSSDSARSKHLSDITEMKPGVFERKWEIDSLCYSVSLIYEYYKKTGDRSVFDAPFDKAMKLIVSTFREQQRKEGKGPYYFMRKNGNSRSSPPNGGYGSPVKPCGLICSAFRPSDDVTKYLFLIPSNLFAVQSLKRIAEMYADMDQKAFAMECIRFAAEVKAAISKYGIVDLPEFGKIFAYETDGMGRYNLMDDANIPGLLSLPVLGIISESDPVYQNTRRFSLSIKNPYYYEGKAAKGIGSPHVEGSRIWTMGIISRAMTASNPEEIRQCLRWIVAADAGTGFIHESFDMDEPSSYSRSWFSWANSLFGQLIVKIHKEHPEILSIPLSE